MNETGVLINHINDDMKSQLPPTDSRFRKDIRLHEQGKHRGATFEKVRLYTMEENRNKELKDLKKEKRDPLWFEETKHPYLEGVNYFLPKEGTDNYWVRRKKRDWQNVPRIFD